MATFLEKVARAKEVVRDGLAEHPNIIGAASFGKDSMVMPHLLKEVKPDIPVFTVLMDTEFEETVDFSRQVAGDWKLNYQEHHAYQGSDVSIEECRGKPKVEMHRQVLPN